MPTIRATDIGTGSANSVNIPFPGTAVAGDTAFIFLGAGYAVNNVSGWSIISNLVGSNFNGAAFYKELTSGDISTGSVTVTFAGSYNFVWAIAVCVGSATESTAAASRNGDGSATITLAASTATKTTDLVLLFGSNRGVDNITIDHGTSLEQLSATEASGALSSYTPTVDGTFDAVFTYPTPGSGNYQAIVSVADGGLLRSPRVATQVVEGAPSASAVVPRVAMYVVEGQQLFMEVPRVAAYVIEGPPSTRNLSQALMGTF